MIRPPWLPAFTLSLVAFAASCGDSDPQTRRLYLALLDSELTVRLVEREPEPF